MTKSICSKIIAPTVLMSLIVALMFHASSAQAQYPNAMKNALLREEISQDQDRLIPLTDHFAFAGDGQGYYRLLGPQDFYHGIGYWLQFRAEAKLSENFRVNSRSILFAGSASNGYAEPSGQFHLLGLSWIWPETVFQGSFRGRILDLGRQTMGLGAVVQDREFNGGLLQWANESHSLTFRADGTGALLLGDDTYNIEAKLYSGFIGLGLIIWPMGVEQDFLAEDRAPYPYLYSTQSFESFTYGLEVGQREQAKAALAFVSAKKDFESLTAEGKIQLRRYENNFANGFTGQIEQLYISYDQYDKDFTNAMNIFVRDDQVDVAAAHLNLFYKLSHAWRFHSLNEVGVFDYGAIEKDPYYFYRHGVQHCPVEDRDDCITFFFSNKVLMDGYTRPPNQVSRSNEALFKESPFAGFEASFRF